MFPLTPTALLETQNLVHVIYHAGVRAGNKCSKWSAFFKKQFWWKANNPIKKSTNIKYLSQLEKPVKEEKHEYIIQLNLNEIQS